eukprot:1158560-Pelagomonas_calceolata.AAC.2
MRRAQQTHNAMKRSNEQENQEHVGCCVAFLRPSTFKVIEILSGVTSGTCCGLTPHQETVQDNLQDLSRLPDALGRRGILLLCPDSGIALLFGLPIKCRQIPVCRKRQ